jgi:hypothetical protein
MRRTSEKSPIQGGLIGGCDASFHSASKLTAPVEKRLAEKKQANMADFV